MEERVLREHEAAGSRPVIPICLKVGIQGRFISFPVRDRHPILQLAGRHGARSGP